MLADPRATPWPDDDTFDAGQDLMVALYRRNWKHRPVYASDDDEGTDPQGPLPPFIGGPEDLAYLAARRTLSTEASILLFVILAALAALLPIDAYSAPSLATVTSTNGPGGSTTWSVPLQTLLTLSALSFLPALLLMMTGFTRIVIVLSLLRMAMGTQTTPPNQVIIGLALFMTLFVMGPTFDRVYNEAWQPYQSNQLPFDQLIDKASPPVKTFMLRQTREADLALFHKLADEKPAAAPEQVPLRILVPAFITSELKTAFQIGFMIFLPFLIVDLVVASVLMSMGMMMVSPVLIALPFKLMLFVMVDGWNLLAASLVGSFSR